MPSLSDALARFRGALVGRRPAAQIDPGVADAVDGRTAVALTEACLTEALGHVSGPGEGVSAAAWRAESSGVDVESGDARGAVAAAEGLALSGVRATAFLDGPDLEAARPGLGSAAARMVPLVAHVTARTTSAPGDATGTGHDPLHAIADFGGFVLVARDVQDAVDLAVAARRCAENALVPGLVAMDARETARSVQDVHLPVPSTLKALCGEPGDRIPCPTPAQEILFGAERRRVPRWIDPERPALLGARHDGASAGLAVAGREPFVDEPLTGALHEAFAAVAARTGRPLDFLDVDGPDRAEICVVACGSAIELARRAARAVGGHPSVQVVGVRALRPFPAKQLAGLLKGRKAVLVLERSEAGLAGETPLAREVRAAMARALENGRFGGRIEGDPAWRVDDLPRLKTAVLGVGGLPARLADVADAIRLAVDGGPPAVVLGLDWSSGDGGADDAGAPRRRAALDRIRRAWPDLVDRGLGRLATGDAGPAAPGELRLRVRRLAGGGGSGLAEAIARLLGATAGGRLRGRPGAADAPWGTLVDDDVDRVGEADGVAGDDRPVDVCIVAIPPGGPGALPPHTFDSLADGGTVVLPVADGGDLGARLSHRDRAAIADRRLTLWTVPVPEGDRLDAAAFEALLGAALAVLTPRLPAPPSAAKLVAAREAHLAGRPEAERTDRCDRFREGLESARCVESVGRETGSDPADAAAAGPPAAVRRFARADEAWDSLPRFWDRYGRAPAAPGADATPDPYATVGAVPPLTATFRDLAGLGSVLPAFDPAVCTGCGACWTACPDAAVEAIALSPAALLDAGMAAATRSGRPADALRRLAGPLAKGMAKRLRDEAAPATFGALLRESFAPLRDKAAADDAARAALDEAIDAVAGATDPLPLARTAALWTTPAPPAPDRIAAARAVVAQLDALPDTPGAVQALAAKRDDVGPAAALLLSRHARAAVVGGDGGAPGDGARTALRLVLACAEAQLQPPLVRHLADIEALRERFAARIRELLGEALPVADLDALAAGLVAVDRSDPRLGDLATRLESARGAGRYDAARLERMVETARELADLHDHLSGEATGVPRARVTVGIAGDDVARWAATFPWNPFTQPVAVDRSGSAASFAAGVHEGTLREVTDRCRFLRAARLELDDPVARVRDAERLASLGWRDLDEDERALLPPLVLVVGEDAIGRIGGDLAVLLASDRPVKVVALSGAADASPGLLALVRRSAFVVQGSIGAADHLVDGARRAMVHPGPALLHVHAPNPARHGFATDAAVATARRAVDSRAFPLFVYDPARTGVFGSRLSLDGNPDPTGDAGPVPLDAWMDGEARFASWTEAARAAAAADRLDAWRTLQELAGVKTPFTERVRREAEAEYAAARDRALETANREAEERIAGLRREVEDELAARLTTRLAELARRGAAVGIGSPGEGSA